MMIAALLALAFGAVAGIFLAVRHFLRKKLPVWVALLHGIGGATGFAFVLLTVVSEPNFRPIRDVLYLLIVTVVLGVVNLTFHIRKKRHRTSLILMHGLVAVSAATMLIRAIVIHVEPSAAAPAERPVASAAPSAAVPAPTTEATAAGPSSDAAAPPASAEPPKEKPAAEGFAVDDAVRQALDQPIVFETKSANISPESLAKIAEIANTLKSHPEIALIEVQGHADERGEDGRNVGLTLARASAVVNALVSNGIVRTRLHSAGYGARCPADSGCRGAAAPESCHGPSSWDRDRRVVFLVLQVGKNPYKGEVACARGADLIPPADRAFHKPGAQ